MIDGYIMSKVALVEDAKLAYVSCPVKHVVDISKTKLDLCVEAPHSAVQPAPTATIAGSIGLGGNQVFDITVFIQEVPAQSLKHISEPTRPPSIQSAVICLNT